MNLCIWTASLFVFASLLPARGDILADRVTFWESQAFYCGGKTDGFPSKVDESDASKCDDGDMTLFNGLLCAAGDDRGCRGVQMAQGSDGRWWRSPRQIGWEAPAHDVSFSPDQSLGVQLYLVHKHQKTSFDKWISWVDANRPCTIEFAGNCLLRGWPRFCRDDTVDKRCTFRPGNCQMIERTGTILGGDGQICKHVMNQFTISPDLFPPLDALIVGSAVVNDTGYPMHLAATEIFLMRAGGHDSDALQIASSVLATREPENPFFAYLAQGRTQKIKEMLIEKCPTPEKPSRARHQWSWERAAADRAWEESMYWDCIFMARLLQ